MTDIVTVPALVAPAPFPTTADRASLEYNGKAKTWADTEGPMADSLHAIAIATRTNAVAAHERAIDAANQVTLATAQANAAVSAAGAVAWVSGATYAPFDTRYSPINLQPYRRKTAGAGTVDPSLDTVNWTPLGGVSLAQLHATALSF